MKPKHDQPKLSKDITDLINATKKPISFEDLCDKLGKTPACVRKLIKDAKELKVDIKLGNNHLQLSPEEQIRTVQSTRILPTSGTRQYIGVMSDLHLGSRYCLREQIKDCVEHFYSRGIRNILIPGDLIDGCYKHGVFELTHSGITDQTRDLFETLPKKKNLLYHAITGNHCFTYAENSGVNVGSYIESYFRDNGRNDMFFYGDRGAFIEIQGAIIHMWHPKGGKAYSKSYRLQRQIEGYSSGQKPHILLAGHWHDFCNVESRGVFGIMCPCFQGGGSAFGKSLGGDVSLGGLIVGWEIAGKDLIRNFSVERRRYFEVELPTKVKGGGV